jgi:predicted lipoprotein with Yx(FWY)xxD motif
MKPRSLTAVVLTVAVIAIAAVALASGGNAKNRQPRTAGGSAINVRHTSLGETLVDANGRTLYLFEGDKRNVSTLSAAGRAVWPPLTVAATVKTEGAAQAAKLGTTSGAFKQVTYNGHPLYYYVGDHAPGSTKGQHLKEFGALWFVLAPSGSAITSSLPSYPTPMPTAATSSYG